MSTKKTNKQFEANTENVSDIKKKCEEKVIKIEKLHPLLRQADAISKLEKSAAGKDLLVKREEAVRSKIASADTIIIPRVIRDDGLKTLAEVLEENPTSDELYKKIKDVKRLNENTCSEDWDLKSKMVPFGGKAPHRTITVSSNRSITDDHPRKVEEASPEVLSNTPEEAAEIEIEKLDLQYAHLPRVCSEIRQWLKTGGPKDLLVYMQGRVKGQPEIVLFVANVVNYLQQVSVGNTHHNNMLLAAPSGCGKTETYRALRDYCKKTFYNVLPVSQYDITAMTANAYRGDDAENLVKSLFEHRETRGIGIIFIDEFDKKLVPSRYVTDAGNKGDMNVEIQAQLLTMIEGKEMSPTSNRLGVEPLTKINTSNTLFIGLGSFDAFRKQREVVDTHMGFVKAKNNEEDHYCPVTKENMVELGASYELLGRMGSVINYQKLTEPVVREIIDGIVEKESKAIGYEVVLEEPMIQYLVSNANSNYGCRLLTELIHERVLRTYAKIMFSDEDKSNIRIVLKDADAAVLEKIEESDK